MRSHIARGLIVVVLSAVAAGQSAALAQPESLPSAGGQPAQADAYVPGVLVMVNGAVFEGRILKTGNSFEVRSRNGTIFVPGDAVKLHCETIREAFRVLRDDLPENGAIPQRISLARWCITNKMVDEARQVLKHALSLDPKSNEVRTLLNRVDEILDPRTPPPEVTAEERLKLARMGGLPDPESQALGGLPRELGVQYIRQVQPLLMNGCALAACHGPQATETFSLQRVMPGRGANRRASEQNLTKILEFVSIEHARSSPLLTVPQTEHGLRGKPVFSGARGETQLDLLKAWVSAVARAQSPATTGPGDTESTVSTAGATGFPKSPPVRQVSAESPAADPFDPAEFNSKTE